MQCSRWWSGSSARIGLVALVGLALTAAVVACGADEEVTCSSDRIRCAGGCILPPVATLDYIQSEIIDPTCNTQLCHGALGTKEELLLTDRDTTCASLLGIESIQEDGAILVVRGNPGQSYLMNKLTGVGMAPRSSLNEPTQQMPNGPAELCDEQVEIIRQWIAAGAPGCP